MTFVISNYNTLIFFTSREMQQQETLGQELTSLDFLKKLFGYCAEKRVVERNNVRDQFTPMFYSPSFPTYSMSGVFLAFCFKRQREFQTKEVQNPQNQEWAQTPSPQKCIEFSTSGEKQGSSTPGDQYNILLLENPCL